MEVMTRFTAHLILTPMYVRSVLPLTLQQRLIREAKFIRALLYFNIVRFWGDAPLILHDPSTTDVNQLKVPRSPKDSVYLQIIKDLTDAANLPKSYTGAD